MHTVALVLALMVPGDLPVPADLVEAAVRATYVHRWEYECLGYSYTKTEKLYDTKGSEPKLKRTRVYRMWYEDGESRQLLLTENGKLKRKAKPESPGPDAFEGLPDRYTYEWAPRFLVFDEDGVLCFALRFRVRPDYEPDGWKEEALGKMAGTMLIDFEHRYVRHIDGALTEPYSKVLGAAKVQHIEFRFWQKWLPEMEIPVFTRTEAVTHYRAIWFISRKELRTFEYSNHQFDDVTMTPPR
jgi:hypothetical protein